MEAKKRTAFVSKMAKIIPLIAFRIYCGYDFWSNYEAHLVPLKNK